MLLAIYGAGGLGREVYEIASRFNAAKSRWSQIVFVDDFHHEGDFYGTRRVHFESFKKMKESCEFLVAVGEPASREKLFAKIKGEGFKFATLIDPTALVSPSAQIEEGTIICEFATIHTGVVLGKNVFLQPYCLIGHDIKVGDHSVLSAFCSPGGSMVIGQRVYIGMQAVLKEKLTVGDDAIVGMGSVVYQDVPANVTVLGNPARVTRGNEERKVFR